ncbi:ATP-dependent RNA helicase SUPV3L1 [Carex littledalei]|uniref:ATP-dependent RNA helicase SUPV3L1 n=1 Tax=Carex littledalei TaxID=544730 RepID=A0A833R1X7_9POAL|nr:ATP-dependent RNA helicase SUPV3L1 [Carex littledalei]
MAELESESAVHRFLFSNFAVFCLNELQDDLKIFKKLMETADLTKPHTWYPFDRPVKRKVNEEASDNDDIKTTRHFWLTSEADEELEGKEGKKNWTKVDPNCIHLDV